MSRHKKKGKKATINRQMRLAREQAYATQPQSTKTSYYKRRVAYGYQSEDQETFLNEYINYWTNFFVFSDEKLEKQKRVIIKRLCLNGIVGVQKLGDDYLIYELATYKQNLYRDIVEATGLIVVLGDKKTVKLKDTNSVLLKTNEDMTAWYEHNRKNMARIERGLVALDIARENSKKQRMITVPEINAGKVDEVMEMYSGDETIKVIATPAGVTKDNIFDMSISSRETLPTHWDDTWKSFQFMQYNDGIRYNSTEKSAEVKQVEAQQSSQWFVAQEGAKVVVIKEMVEKLNKLYGTGIEVKTIVELEQERAQQQAEQQEEQGEKDDE